MEASLVFRLRSAGLIVGMVGLSRAAAAQKLFQGTITYEVRTSNAQTQIVISARGKKLRQERHRADEPEATRDNFVLVDYGRGEVTTVFAAMKRYVVFDFKRIHEMVRSRAQTNSEDDQTLFGDIIATGRKEKVAGLECEVYAFKNIADEDWCVTTAIGRLIGVADSAGAGTDDRALAQPTNDATAALLRSFKSGALILRMRATDRNGFPVTTIATKVDRSSPAERLFAVPAGYEELDQAIFGKP